MEINLVIDAIIAVLLIATIAYAAVLNRKLGVLRDGKSEMEALIISFSESTERASNGVESLKQEARRSGAALQNKVESARGLVDDLGFLIEKGSKLADRLDGGIGMARAKPAIRQAAEAAAEPPSTVPKSPAERPAAEIAEAAPGTESGGDPTPDAGAVDLATAESELVKALQGMR